MLTTEERTAFANDLSRFFALEPFDAPRTMAVHRIKDGTDDTEDRRVVRERLQAYVRNGYASAKTFAAKHIVTLNRLQ